ncbi:MAG: Fe2+-dicitrate sensor, rane component, partial [Flavipsychrobacter sp.]|nr:Fe2+-dicitrate sensor, rane component [Flavipsychrobacter sp.]
ATPLWRLVDVLNEAYGVNIIIGNPRLKNLELTTTFRNEPIENILAVVSETLNIHVERKGIDIILK